MADKGESRKYYYQNDQGVFGPCTSREIKQAAASGSLRPTDSIWSSDSPKKSLAISVKNLAFATPTTNSTDPQPDHNSPSVAQPSAQHSPQQPISFFPQIREARPSILSKHLLAFYEDRLSYLSKFSPFFKLWELDDKSFELPPEQLAQHLSCNSTGTKKENVRRIVAAVIPRWINGNYSPVLIESVKGSLKLRAWRDQLPQLLEWLPERSFVRRLGFFTFVDILMAIIVGVLALANTVGLTAVTVGFAQSTSNWIAIPIALLAFAWGLLFLSCTFHLVLAAVYRACWSRLDSLCAIPLALTAIVPLIGVSVWLSIADSPEESLPAISQPLQLLIALAHVGVHLYFPIRVWIGDKLVPAKREFFHAKPRRSRMRLRVPLRSSLLSIPLKIAGIAGLVAFWSPLSRPIYQWIDAHAPSNNLAFQEGSIVTFLLTAPSAILLYLGYRLAHVSPLTSKDDTRRPILFLRPFSSDNATTIQPRGVLATLCGLDKGYNRYGDQASERGKLSLLYLWTAVHPIRVLRLTINRCVDSAEESLVRFFAKLAPVYAIGKPGEVLPTPGAHRLYPGDNWQEVIQDFLSRAQAVIVQPGTSEGVLWELQQIRQKVPYFRVLLSLVTYKRDPEGYEQLRKALWESWGTNLPRSLPFRKNHCFVWLDENWQPIVQELSYTIPLSWPFTGNSIDLPYTLHPFIQGMHGGEREPPRNVRWRHGWQYYTIFVPTLVVAIAVAVAPNFIVDAIANAWQARGLDENMANLPDRVQSGKDGAEENAGFFGSATQSYNGKSMNYSFSLEGDWKSQTAESPIEYQFRANDSAFEMQTFPKVRLMDIYNGDFGEQMLPSIQARVRGALPFASVELLEDKWIEINGTQWRSLLFSQKFTPVLNETRLSLFTVGDTGSLNATIILPNRPNSVAVRNKIMQSLKAPPSHIDKLKSSVGAGRQTDYRGKKASYSLRLNEAWKSNNDNLILQDKEATERVLEAATLSDHSFVLGEPPCAVLEVLVVDLATDEQFDAKTFTTVDCEEILDSRREMLKSIVTIPVTVSLTDHRVVHEGQQDWLEIRSKITLVETDYEKQSQFIVRMTKHQDKVVSFCIDIVNDHPLVRSLVDEAIGSIKLLSD